MGGVQLLKMKRVRAVIDNETIYNVFDASGTLVFVENASTGIETDYIIANGQTVARLSNGTVTYLHADHLGSPQAGTNEVGDIAWREHYMPFGESLINDAANDNHGGYTGHIKDSASGLTYMQARYYDPVIGRFLSVDPVGFFPRQPGMFNRYAYTLNDPINDVDQDGQLCRACASLTQDYKSALVNVLVKDLQLAQKVSDEQTMKYPGKDDMGDAMRHATTSKILSEKMTTKRVGAFVLGVANEVKGYVAEGDKKNAIGSIMMDLNNNREGRRADAEGREIDPNNLITYADDSVKNAAANTWDYAKGDPASGTAPTTDSSTTSSSTHRAESSRYKSKTSKTIGSNISRKK